MSADNWAICPRCWDTATKEHEASVQRVQALYGQLSVEEFDAQRESLAQTQPKRDDFYTFREDYEFYGAEDGEVTADYSGSCSKCRLALNFKESRRFYP